jgi:photosystem II stability/assembly factor-like uncharacterized protein
MSGASSLWVTHNAGQTWSRGALPAGNGTGCDVEPAFDGSQRVVVSIFTDAPDQHTPACAHSQYFLSDDDGASWRAIALAALTSPISQEGDGFMVVSARHLFLNIALNQNQGHATLERSDDAGRSWQRADQGLEALLFVPRAPWFAQSLDGTGDALVTSVPTDSGGSSATADLWVTHDAGAHWQRVQSQPLPGSPLPLGPSCL